MEQHWYGNPEVSGSSPGSVKFSLLISHVVYLFCLLCVLSDSSLVGLSHHIPSPLSQPCEEDTAYQLSTSDVSARWTVPETLQPYVTHVLWAVQQELGTSDGTGTLALQTFPNINHHVVWTAVKPFSHDAIKLSRLEKMFQA